MKKYILPLILTFVILGCTQQGGTSITGGNGLVINNFITDMLTVYGGDSIALVASLENKGTETANNVFGKLKSTGTLNVGNPATVTLNYLESGDIDEMEWTLTVPTNVIEGETFHPSAMICYSYETDGYKDLLLVDSAWKGELPTLVEYTAPAPVVLTYSTTTQPIKGARDFSIKITATLSDNGFVANDIESEDDYGTENYLAEIEVTIPTDIDGDGERDITNADGTDNYFTCSHDNDNSIYTCTAKAETLKVLNSYADGRIYLTVDEIDGNYEKIIRAHVKTKYRHCVETVQDYPITLTATTD